MKEILLNIETKEVRSAILKNGVLNHLTVERKKERQITGNIYKGKVTNILHNIQSAFIYIAEGENGFIHISDIIENTKKFEEMFDMDFDLDYDISKVDMSLKAQNQKIDQILKIDQSVIVQVVKEPIGTKGARLTSKISLPGRYLVLLPNSPHRGVSRKIEDPQARDRLKRIIRSFDMPQSMGLICRTASQNATQEMLISEATELMRTWQTIMENFNRTPGAGLLFEESDIIKKAVMMAVDKRFERLLVDDYNVYKHCQKIYAPYAGEHPLRIEFYRDKMPIFERFGIEKEIEKSLRHKIWLGSGGYLFFDQTEAMHTIDVNSGRSKNVTAQDVEETLVRINLEAAEEIARQLRIRNVGGLIICDFIDMRSRKNQRRVLDHFKDCLKEDSAKCTVIGMSELGLVEMTRQRNRGSLLKQIYTHCPYCSGSGHIKTHESISIEMERELKKVINLGQQFALKLSIHPHLHQYLAESGDKEFFNSVAESMNARLEWEENDELHLNQWHFYSSINQKLIEV